MNIDTNKFKDMVLLMLKYDQDLYRRTKLTNLLNLIDYMESSYTICCETKEKNNEHTRA